MSATRRHFIGFGVAVCLGVTVTGLGSLLPQAWFPRPPRALAGNLFTARCMRCGACVQVCPTSALALRDLSLDFRNIGVPYIQGWYGGCVAWERDGCLICAEVCPSNALDSAMELTGMRLAVVRFAEQDCINCLGCMRRCPLSAIYFPNPEGGPSWHKGQEDKIPVALKSANSPVKPIIDESLCVGCALCMSHCLPRIMYLAPWGKSVGGST